MSDIFLSYAAEDRATAERLAHELSARGWSVWWDRHIPLGRPFDDEIERALAQARCAIVLWSHASVESDWVKSEATEARERRVLLPVVVEDVRPPLEFRRLQTGRLIGWPSDGRHEGFERLIGEVDRMLARPGEVRPEGAAASPSDAPGGTSVRGPVHDVALALLPTVGVALLVAGLAAWRVPTGVRLTLPVERVTFTVADSNQPLVRILDALSFPALTVERFETVAIDAAQVEVADPSQYVLSEDRYPDTAWRMVEGGNGALQFEALDERLLPALTIQRASSADGPIGTLRPVVVSTPSEVSLEIGDGRARSLIIRLSQPRPALVVPMMGPLQVTAVQAKASSHAEADISEQASTWRVDLREGAAPIEVKGRSGTLVAAITLPAIPPREGLALFSAGTIPISAIDFSIQDALGRRVSSVVGDGQLGYLDADDAEPRVVERSSVVTLGQLRTFGLRRISAEPAQRGLRLELEGVAGVVTTERGSLLTDHRSTALGALHREPALAILGLLIWGLATGWAVYRLRARRVAVV